MRRHTKRMLDLTPMPVDGPLEEGAFFAERSPVPGVRPCRRLGLGTAWLGQHFGKPEQGEGIETLHAAWGAGFVLVDTAPGYGPAELLLGEALARWDGERPVVATKTKQRDPDLTRVIGQYETSVERLGAIDLLAVHDPQPEFPAESRAAIRDYIAELLDAGRIIGAGLGGGGPTAQAQWLGAGTFRYIITYNRLGALSLQGLTDTVPQARADSAAVFAASPLFLGLLGSRQNELLGDPPGHYPAAYIERARSAMRLADEWSLPLTHLALRFLLSMPAVDVVLAGAANRREWADVEAAYDAGPLPADLYARVWRLAQQGSEAMAGG